jgi:hypothetical protein
MQRKAGHAWKATLKTHLAMTVLWTGALLCPVHGSEFNGPLRVSQENPRYFTDNSGKAIYLTGSHHWYNLVDMGPTDPPPQFDNQAYLDWMVGYHHNFMRLWTWELTTWDTHQNNPKNQNQRTFHHVSPLPWPRTGPGKAADGKPRFDVTKFNPDYFNRLRTRVISAGEKGIYVSVMLFEGWGVQRITDGFLAHPFHQKNNINQINGDQNSDGHGLEIHELAIPVITNVQEAYIKEVIDTVNDLDNVLYEISNENHPESSAWQYHMIDFIQTYERDKPKQHPVGMTFQYKGGSNQTLFDSPADWVSPNPDGGYRDNPPANVGNKVIVTDTDHLWGIGGNQAWVWKSFCRGLNPIFMDPYDGIVLGNRFDAQWDPIRRSMGYTLKLAQRLDLTTMTPQNHLASTQYCLADPGHKYIIYLPQGNQVSVDLSAYNVPFEVRWFNPAQGDRERGDDVQGGRQVTLQSPFAASDAILVLIASN